MTRNILGLRWGPEIVMLYKCRQKYCLKNKTELNFTVEDASERNRAWAAPVAQTRFPPSTPGATLCEETQGFVRFLTFKCHLDAAIPLRSAITALQIKHEHVSSYSNANWTLDHQTHWHSALNHLIDILRNQLYHASEDIPRKAAPVAQTRFPILPPAHALSEKVSFDFYPPSRSNPTEICSQ
jgi:hypothetical protein